MRCSQDEAMSRVHLMEQDLMDDYARWEKKNIFYDRKCITAIGAQILVMAGFFFTFLLKKRNPFLNEGMSMNMTRTANCHATKGY